MRKLQNTLKNFKLQADPGTADELYFEQRELDLQESIDAERTLVSLKDQIAFIEDLLEMNVKDPLPQEVYIRVSSERRRLDSSQKQLKTKIDNAKDLEKDIQEKAARIGLRKIAEQAGAINPDIIVTLLIKETSSSIKEDGSISLTTNLGTSLKDKVNLMKGTPEYGYLFSENKKTSTQQNQRENYNNLTKANPWKREFLSLTKQGVIIRNNPDLARQLIFEAGHNPESYGLS